MPAAVTEMAWVVADVLHKKTYGPVPPPGLAVRSTDCPAHMVAEGAGVIVTVHIASTLCCIIKKTINNKPHNSSDDFFMGQWLSVKLVIPLQNSYGSEGERSFNETANKINEKK